MKSLTLPWRHRCQTLNAPSFWRIPANTMKVDRTTLAEDYLEPQEPA